MEKKHLITLEPAISVAQTDEMTSAKLQLVVPLTVQSTYKTEQKPLLLKVKDFVEHVRKQVGE